MTSSAFVPDLLNWYQHNARELPWRGSADPYAIWISEIMLQQTRVEAVIPYYQRWMERFPEVQTLSAATQQEVLAVWEGLGYYARARQLHSAAQLIVEKYGGQLPRTAAELQRLPGIGAYTAGAIASIAFGADEAALDGNIRRVLARLFNVTEPIRTSAGERRLWQLARQHLPPGRAGEYNQALMDLGATLCTPRQPRCLACPIAAHCQAFALGLQEQRPVQADKTVLPHYIVTAAVITRRGQVLIAQRPARGLLGGLWEFPGGKQQPGEDLHACLQREILEELGVKVEPGQLLGTYQHAYTHFRVTLHAFCCRLPDGEQPRPLQVQQVRWAKPAELPSFPMGKIDRQIARKLLTLGDAPC